MKKTTLSIFILLSLIGCSIDGDLAQIPADTGSGFHHPYFLFIPEEALKDGSKHLIVEPNNTGFTSDDFDDHLGSADNLATNPDNLGNFLAHELGYPLLIPVFPRPDENWKIYTHALDRDVMLQKDGSLERIDLQLLSMIEDAQRRLRNQGFVIEDQVLMAGFSASATFANRFTALHPTKVKAYAAGGLNAILILPIGQADTLNLDYPLGINDFTEITGKEFDSLAFQNTPQFLFMGELDDNDAAQYGDAYEKNERELIFSVLGTELPARWVSSQNRYREYGVNAQLKTYSGIGHELTKEIRDDVLTFFRENIRE